MSAPPQSAPRPTLRRLLSIALVAWATSRLVFDGLALAGSYSLAQSVHGVAAREPHPYAYTPVRVLDVFVRWDALHYLGIAADGYEHGERQYRVAFFPLWPLLLRSFERLGVDAVLAGSVLNHLALLAGLALLLGSRATSARHAWWLAAATLITPATFYYSALYPDALFYLCTVAVVVLGRERPWAAAAIAAVASALRPQGMLLAAFLGAIALERRSLRHVAAAGVGVLGLAAYMLYLHQEFGDPLAFAHVQSHWKRSTGVSAPWTAFLKFDREPDHYALALLALYLIYARIRRRAPWPETALGALMVAMPLATGSLLSFPRFFLAMVPLHLELVEPSTSRRLQLGYGAVAVIYCLVETYRLGRGWTFF